jgi:hypothetical protein
MQQIAGQFGAPMTHSPAQLSKCIDDRLAEIIHQVTDARDAFAGITHPSNRAVDAKLEQLRSRASARSSQFQKERDRVNSKVKRALTHAKEMLEAWKDSGQTEKLRRYADQAEQYAMAAILDANDAIDAALIAAMDSLAARLSAEAETRKS